MKGQSGSGWAGNSRQLLAAASPTAEAFGSNQGRQQWQLEPEPWAPGRGDGCGGEEELSSQVPAGAVGAKEGARGVPSPRELSPALGQMFW